MILQCMNCGGTSMSRVASETDLSVIEIDRCDSCGCDVSYRSTPKTYLLEGQSRQWFERVANRMRVLEAQAEVAAAEKRHQRAASQMGIFETTDGGQTWRHLGDRGEYDASYKALVIARNTAAEE